MKTLAIVSLKGGAGKTTVSLTLAMSAPDPSRVALIDLDPQASSAAARRTMDGGPATVTAEPTRLRAVLQVAERAGSPLSIIDTPPALDDAMRAAVRAADFALIVVRPAPLDLVRLPDALAAVRREKARHAVLLNACPPESRKMMQEAVAFLVTEQAPLAPCRLGQRDAFQRLAVGVALNGDARREADALYRYVQTQLYD